MRAKKLTPTLLVTTLCSALGLGLLVAPNAQANMAMDECTDEGNLCVESGGEWASGAKTTSKERRKQSMKQPATFPFRVVDGRGSLFVNGRYAGTAPLEGIEIPAGKNDIQVRDGAEVLASGVLTVNSGSDVIAVVRHP